MGAHVRARAARPGLRAAVAAAAVTTGVVVAASVIVGGVAVPTRAAAAAPIPADAPAAAPAVAIPAAAPVAARPRAAAPAPAARPAPASTPAGSKPSGSAPPPAPVAVDGTPCTSAAKACVDIADGQAWLFKGGAVMRGPVQVMTGDQDDPTPVGTFHVQWKAEQYTSRQYLVQMPYSVFFADGGVAFHEGRQDTQSAGCVKLGEDDAIAFFNYLQVGDEVQVH